MKRSQDETAKTPRTSTNSTKNVNKQKGLVREMMNNNANPEWIAMMKNDSGSQDAQLQDAYSVCQVRTISKDTELTSTSSTILQVKNVEKRVVFEWFFVVCSAMVMIYRPQPNMVRCALQFCIQ